MLQAFTARLYCQSLLNEADADIVLEPLVFEDPERGVLGELLRVVGGAAPLQRDVLASDKDLQVTNPIAETAFDAGLDARRQACAIAGEWFRAVLSARRES